MEKLTVAIVMGLIAASKRRVAVAEKELDNIRQEERSNMLTYQQQCPHKTYTVSFGQYCPTEYTCTVCQKELTAEEISESRQVS